MAIDRAELEKRYGAAGQAAIERIRAEHAFNFPKPTRPTPPTPPPAPQPAPEPEPQPEPSRLKIWPAVGLAAIRSNHGGAWRLYALAKWIDQAGAGWIRRAELLTNTNISRVGERKRRRWLADAVSLGLLSECRSKGGEVVFYLAGLARAAAILGAEHIGLPATIGASHLVGAGWRSHVWAAYLVTLKGRPISQAQKERLTGVSERTQRNYQSEVPGGGAIFNYADLKLSPDQVDGVRAVSGRNVFTAKDGKVKQRLPDIRIVPPFVSLSLPKGRSRKAQRTLNASLSIEPQAKGAGVYRLFCETPKELKATMRKISHDDIPPWEGRPAEVFEYLPPWRASGRKVNNWRAVSV